MAGRCRPPRARWRARAGGAVLAAVLVAAPLAALTWREPTGWAGTARAAAALLPALPVEAARLQALPAGAPAFTESAAASWLADRPAVWSPLDSVVAGRIADWLAPAVPGPGGS